MARIGLNAQLYVSGMTYRSAGVSHYIDRLLAYLPEIGKDWDGVAFVAKDAPDQPGWHTVRSPWRTRSPWARILWEQTLQPVEIARNKLDLLHSTVYAGPLASNCPQVVTIHDLTFFLHPDTLRLPNRKYLQHITRWTASRAQMVITSASSTAADITRVLGIPPERIVMIPDGVDATMRPVPDATQLADLRKRYSLPSRFVLFLGTLEPRKNIPALLEAWAILVDRGAVPEHKLVIAGGKGWYFDEIDQAVHRLGLADQIIFPGFVPQKELATWYSAAELFVYPSIYEGFGLPPLEAMACGTPVITSNVSSLPEVVGDAGRTVSPSDPQAIADEMAALLLDDMARRELTTKGLAQASRFSWHETARKTHQVYTQVLGESHG